MRLDSPQAQSASFFLNTNPSVLRHWQAFLEAQPQALEQTCLLQGQGPLPLSFNQMPGLLQLNQHGQWQIHNPIILQW